MTVAYKGTPTFTHIKNDVLRSWNQASMFFNLIGERSLGDAKQYLKQLPMVDRERVAGVYRTIVRDGYESTRAAVNRTLQNGVFEYDA